MSPLLVAGWAIVALLATLLLIACVVPLLAERFPLRAPRATATPGRRAKVQRPTPTLDVWA